MTRIYLSGPIHGCSDAEVHEWREQVKGLLSPRYYEIIDPTERDYRGTEQEHERLIVQEDLVDILDSDWVIANTARASWGTAMELVYAKQFGKRVISVGPNTSPWLRWHAKTKVSSLAHLLTAL